MNFAAAALQIQSANYLQHQLARFLMPLGGPGSFVAANGNSVTAGWFDGPDKHYLRLLFTTEVNAIYRVNGIYYSVKELCTDEEITLAELTVRVVRWLDKHLPAR